ncbi:MULTISPECIES: GuaB1 family IMP dehydrogenase-related protein [unclassified Microbacterium]|uniref:GMP reductase n=1 Tax=unclassified Microbacterium TaxID=2609290 RepID=UPI002468C7F3|nr:MULTISPECIES: GuaB1 family IMP dehydrogenase-related protein [unclassified Microbacterium]MDH5133774.1 GuaB1 family IMP dehydrogenase-related protein [Microbacterium sp. RD10]MDH5137365.1 GuaB1 family IMP dehydrogenase-related protein [Microbacterium sp. RD11]MDH5146665.1 GuaB1 family IMP dehydrogenase-related protein [Microbacterium sp. RD12]MDH5155496.1 GuaB1 family IMP dehydrogenase-related protein [Microbacterium sp. RD06]MDH5165491.1 GuaB1 family IMP dehydrogenase-related protein [Micr
MEFSGAQPTVDLTYSDVFLVPRRSAVTSRLQVDLAPHDGTPATLPLVAANMNSVTGPRIAAVLARRGALGVLPQDLPLQELDAAIRDVKGQPVLWDTPLVLPPEATVADALRLLPAAVGHGIVVAHGAAPIAVDRIVGVLPATRLATALPDAQLGDLVHRGTPSIDADDIGSERHAFDVITEADVEIVTVVHHGHLVGTLSARSALRATLYRPAVDADGRLAVAAAVGINGDVAAKAKALAAAGVDVLVVDTAHGHQEGMLRALQEVASLGLGLPIVAGNIVTADGVRDFVDAGASILKVGVGPGAMCTTRMMTAVGRPQFSAVLETAEAAAEAGAHVWADGGVRYPRDVALALAAGAASVMVGSWFAGTIEAPGELQHDADGRLFKESWGMASTKAVQARFGRLDAYERARKELFAEGISSSKIYLDPLRPGVEDLLDMITSGVRSSFTYAGAATVPEFHERALVGLQSAAGYEEGKALPVSW